MKPSSCPRSNHSLALGHALTAACRRIRSAIAYGSRAASLRSTSPRSVGVARRVGPRLPLSPALLAALGALSIAGSATRAEACGGLFCSSAAPVNQAAERIIFAFDKDQRRVHTVVEILYQGPAERFAWLLPVPGTPDVGVSSGAMLRRLQATTNPTYALQRSWPDEAACDDLDSPTAAGGGPIAFGASDSGGEDGGQVDVVDSGVAGPYQYETLSVRDGDQDPADAAVEWLADNGYDLGDIGADVLRPYLEGGMNLLAVRLTKGRSTGAIRPLRLDYDAERPMIPIRPTAVAANANMGVLVWMLGDGRAAPTNYRSLEINEARLDWFNPNAAYNDLINAAANEATDDTGLSGHGFVTELAEPTSARPYADLLFRERAEISGFRSQADVLGDIDLIEATVQRFRDLSTTSFGGPFGAGDLEGPSLVEGIDEVLARNLALPEGVSAEQFASAPSCYLRELPEEQFYCEGQVAPSEPVDLSAFDRAQFLTDMEELVFAPLQETAQLFSDYSYVTRLYTTLSPEEMSLDPEFDLNPDLADVSEQHSLTLQYDTGCRGDTSGTWSAEVHGLLVRGEGNTWPFAERQPLAADMPAVLRSLSFTQSGPLAVEQDNTAGIEELLDLSAQAFPSPDGSLGNGESPIGAGGPRSSGGCSLGGAPSSRGLGPFSLLSVLGWAFLSRRRRRRSDRTGKRSPGRTLRCCCKWAGGRPPKSAEPRTVLCSWRARSRPSRRPPARSRRAT